MGVVPVAKRAGVHHRALCDAQVLARCVGVDKVPHQGLRRASHPNEEDRDPLRETRIENQKETPNLNILPNI